MALCELFSLCIKSLSNCYSVRYSPRSLEPSLAVYRPYFRSDWVFRFFPMYRIFDLLRSIHPDFFIGIRDDSRRELKLRVETLEIIIKWLQVSVLSEYNRQILRTKKFNLCLLGTCFPTTGRLVWLLYSLQSGWPSTSTNPSLTLGFEVWVLIVFSYIYKLAPCVINTSVSPQKIATLSKL